MDAGRHQGLAPRRVAIHHGVPGRARLAHALGVEIERDVGDVLLFEEARQVLAATPVAADDDVALGVEATAPPPG
jgi:hypothetical protein